MEKLITTMKRCFTSFCRTRPGESSQAGFTLIEVLIVTFILSVAILGMEGLQLYAIQQIQRSDDIGTAASIAQDVMETLRAQPYDVLQDSSMTSPITVTDDARYDTSGYIPDDQKDKLKGRGGSEYYVSWRVRPGPSGDEASRFVDVIVRYTTMGHEDTSLNFFDPHDDFSSVKGVNEFFVTSLISP